MSVARSAQYYTENELQAAMKKICMTIPRTSTSGIDGLLGLWECNHPAWKFDCAMDTYLESSTLLDETPAINDVAYGSGCLPLLHVHIIRTLPSAPV